MVLWEVHGTEDTFQAREWMIVGCRPAFEDILVGDDDRVAAVGRFTRLPKIPLELSERRLHDESDYLIPFAPVNRSCAGWCLVDLAQATGPSGIVRVAAGPTR
jgi:hypothetical protein